MQRRRYKKRTRICSSVCGECMHARAFSHVGMQGCAHKRKLACIRVHFMLWASRLKLQCLFTHSRKLGSAHTHKRAHTQMCMLCALCCGPPSSSCSVCSHTRGDREVRTHTHTHTQTCTLTCICCARCAWLPPGSSCGGYQGGRDQGRAENPDGSHSHYQGCSMVVPSPVVSVQSGHGRALQVRAAGLMCTTGAVWSCPV